MLTRSELFHLSQANRSLSIVHHADAQGHGVFVGEVDGKPCVSGPSRHTTMARLLRYVAYSGLAGPDQVH